MPDLREVSISATPVTFGAGGTVSIADSVRSSNGASTAFVVKYYLSADSTITATDTLLGSRTVSSLASGASSTVTSTFTVAAGTVGSYYVGAIVDANSQVAESNETNNSTAATQITITKPDLAVTALSGSPSSILPGGVLGISSTVKSTGGATTSFVMRFYLSTDATITSTDTLLGSRTVSSLASGATSTATTNATIPATIAPGAYYLGAIADADGQVAETDESNNTRSGSGFTITKPDLAITSVASTPTSLGAGGTLAVTDTVKATGGATSGFSVKYYLSTDQTVTAGDLYLGSRTVASLASGASSTATTNLTLPGSVAPGTYYVGAIADADAQVAESNEANNALAAAASTVQKPDLVVSSVTATPTSVESGGTLAITDSVQTTGAVATSFVVKYYLSTDATFSSSDTLIGSRTISSLAYGASSLATTSVMLPAGAAGALEVLAVVDANAQISEANESNNTTAGTVVTIQRPDLVFSSLTASPTTVLAGGATVAITDTVVSVGGASTAFGVKYYVSADAIIDAGDTVLGSRTVPALASGASSTATTTVILPSALAGTCYVGAILDSGNVVQESNEGNDASAGVALSIVTNGQLDLVPTSLTAVSSAVAPRGSLEVTSGVRALGQASPSFRVRFYLSSDTSITASDTSVGYRDVGPLASGGTSTETTILKMPNLLGSTTSARSWTRTGASSRRMRRTTSWSGRWFSSAGRTSLSRASWCRPRPSAPAASSLSRIRSRSRARVPACSRCTTTSPPTR